MKNDNTDKNMVPLIIAAIAMLGIDLGVIAAAHADKMGGAANFPVWVAFTLVSTVAILWAMKVMKLNVLVIAGSYGSGAIIALIAASMAKNVSAAELVTAGAIYGALGAVAVSDIRRKVRFIFLPNLEIPLIALIGGFLVIDVVLNMIVVDAAVPVLLTGLILPFGLAGMGIGMIGSIFLQKSNVVQPTAIRSPVMQRTATSPAAVRPAAVRPTPAANPTAQKPVGARPGAQPVRATRPVRSAPTTGRMPSLDDDIIIETQETPMVPEREEDKTFSSIKGLEEDFVLDSKIQAPVKTPQPVEPVVQRAQPTERVQAAPIPPAAVSKPVEPIAQKTQAGSGSSISMPKAVEPVVFKPQPKAVEPAELKPQPKAVEPAVKPQPISVPPVSAPKPVEPVVKPQPTSVPPVSAPKPVEPVVSKSRETFILPKGKPAAPAAATPVVSQPAAPANVKSAAPVAPQSAAPIAPKSEPETEPKKTEPAPGSNDWLTGHLSLLNQLNKKDK